MWDLGDGEAWRGHTELPVRGEEKAHSLSKMPKGDTVGAGFVGVEEYEAGTDSLYLMP